VQTSTFPDLPPGQGATEASAGEDFDINETANNPVPGAPDDSEDAAGDLRDRDLASQASSSPQIATRYPGAILLTALALGLLLARAVFRR